MFVQVVLRNTTDVYQRNQQYSQVDMKDIYLIQGKQELIIQRKKKDVETSNLLFGEEQSVKPKSKNETE